MTKYYPIYYTDAYGELQDGGITGTYAEAVAEARSLSMHTSDEVFIEVDDQYVDFYSAGRFAGREKAEDLL